MKENHCSECDKRLFDFNNKKIKLKCPRCGEYEEITYEELKEKYKERN